MIISVLLVLTKNVWKGATWSGICDHASHVLKPHDEHGMCQLAERRFFILSLATRLGNQFAAASRVPPLRWNPLYLLAWQ